MIQLIAFIIFILSFGLLTIVLFRKIPELRTLPHYGHHGIKKPKIIAKIEKKIKDTHFNLFERQMFLHRILSKTKVWVLKAETRIDTLLHRVRKKAQKTQRKTTRKSK